MFYFEGERVHVSVDARVYTVHLCVSVFVSQCVCVCKSRKSPFTQRWLSSTLPSHIQSTRQNKKA